MQAAARINLLQHLRPVRLAGALFDKELRVASRRRRLYVLRFVYVCLLTFVVVRLWLSVRQSSAGGPGVVQIARLGEMGKQIIATVVWFQFLTGQILAAVLLSDAIGKEIRQRTLDSLLVTPVRSFQIVLGKLAGRLLQAASLLAISLPLLAIVRVFGGVPWDYVLAALCVTLSAGVFAGAVSLLCSISSRDSYHAVLTVVLCYFVIWGLSAFLLAWLLRAGYLAQMTVLPSLFALANPFVVLKELTERMTWGIQGGGVSLFWLWHCLILWALAAVLLAWSARRVRRIAQAVIFVPADAPSEENVSSARGSRAKRGIRRVVGAPVVWKERCVPLFRARWHRWLSLGLLILVVAFIVAVALYTGAELPIMAFFLAVIVQLLFAIDLAIAAAGAVTKEKEARTWPVLLMTPLEGADIVTGKALGVLRRNLPLLLPLPVLYLLALLPDRSTQMHFWQVVVMSGLMVAGLVSTACFLLGMGLYSSVRLTTTTAATVATLIGYVFSLFLFGGSLGPLLLLLAGMLNRMGVHQRANTIPLATLAFALVAAGIYVGLGLFFLRRSAARVRRNVF